MFNGAITAIVTPFRDGRLDEKAFRQLVEWQIQQGIHGIVVGGTTGESPTLTQAEVMRLTQLAVEQSAGRVPIIAGSGSNSTATTISHTEAVREAGAAAALIVAPYYNKPPQEGLYLHYRTVARAVNIPIIIYNVPGRTAVDIQPETILRLTEEPTIVGVKECAGLERIQKLRSLLPTTFTILSGEDALNAASYEKGANGTISVLSNIMPTEVATIYSLAQSGHSQEATQRQEAVLPLISALFKTANPIPVKTALALMGHVTEEFRLPLTTLSTTDKTELATILRSYQLIH